MSAALLREAADRLDALADAATSGPWTEGGESVWNGVIAGGRNIINGCCDEDGWLDKREDAAYIAAMSPTVGKALAAWLREASAWPTCWPEALAVARAVLGRDA